MSDPKLAKAESEDVNIRANPRELCHVSYNEDLILPLTSKLEVMSTDEKTPEEIETLKTLVFDCVDTLSSSVECDEDDTDLSPTPTTERLCSKNNVLPNSASAEGDIGEFAALIAKAKEKKGNMTFSFPEPEFLKEIPKYDREYEDHELEDASDLIPLMLSTQRIKGESMLRYFMNRLDTNSA